MEEVINITDLSYSYPDGQKALEGVSLKIIRGETVGLLGPNGAGKSTLLLHFNGILHSNGAVQVLGRAIKDNNLGFIRSKVGLVFQNPDDQLFSPTVFDDVAFGPLNMGCTKAEVLQTVQRALEWVGMAGYENRSPHHLSWGERKRVAIATVLAMSPEILVLDEPSSNLDPRGKWALIDLLKKLPQTKIIASHDLELVQDLCQRIVILDRGRIVADGNKAGILSDTSLLALHGLGRQDELVI
ncbi:MAG: ATP-binding cassette domain-containing protein [Dehalococcoidales bacterium]|nr:ATP-binding cassette domain-containing protein [Dehalococcoidales bacterium]